MALALVWEDKGVGHPSTGWVRPAVGQEGQKERPSQGTGGDLLRGAGEQQHPIPRDPEPSTHPHTELQENNAQGNIREKKTKGTEGSPLGWSLGREVLHISRDKGSASRRTCSRQRLLPEPTAGTAPTPSRGVGYQERTNRYAITKTQFQVLFPSSVWALASLLSSGGHGGHGSSEGCGEDGPAQTLHMQTDHNTNSHMGESLNLPRLPQPGIRFLLWSLREGCGPQPGGRSSKHGGHKTESAS